MATAGIVCGLISLAIALLIIFVIGTAFMGLMQSPEFQDAVDEMQKDMQEMQQEMQQEMEQNMEEENEPGLQGQLPDTPFTPVIGFSRLALAYG